MSLRHGLTLSMLFHVCLFTALLTISMGEGGKRIGEEPIFVRLANDVDISTIKSEIKRTEIKKGEMFKARFPNPESDSVVKDSTPSDGINITKDNVTISQTGGSPLVSGNDNGAGHVSSLYTSETPGSSNGIKQAETPVESYITIPDAINLIRDLIERAKRYPPLARRRGIEGTVHVRFKIDKDGSPYDIEVINSSGYSILDKEGIDVIKRAGHFPYIDKAIEVPISFILDEG